LKEAVFHLGRFGSTISGMDVAIMKYATVVSVVTAPINETKLHPVRIANPPPPIESLLLLLQSIGNLLLLFYG
jgi:hypothetical protein